MSEEDSKDNERENDKKPQGVLSGVGSNPTPGALKLQFKGVFYALFWLW